MEQHIFLRTATTDMSLGTFWNAICIGTYQGVVAPVDIAPTFASLLRINRPSAAVGRVLTEASA
jgi:hypothetical protein